MKRGEIMEGGKWEQSELIKHACMGDNEAVDMLVENNLGLVHSVVKKFSKSPYDSEDLFQIGCVGLFKAIKKFDLSYDVRFSTYAVPMIMGEIKRFLRDDGPVKVGRRVKELAIKAKNISELIQKQTGTAPSVHEIGAMLGKSGEEIAAALDAVMVPESIYGIADDKIGAIDLVAADGESEEHIVDKIALRDAISELAARERQIIIFRYFKNKTQSEVADLLGISQVQVSRLEKKILAEMRKKMAV